MNLREIPVTSIDWSNYIVSENLSLTGNVNAFGVATHAPATFVLDNDGIPVTVS